MPFDEDLSQFFSTADFGDAATFTPTGGAAKTVNGIFDGPGVVVGGVELQEPSFVCASADVDGVAHGDAIRVRASSYVVVGIGDDGTGLVRLKLQDAT